MNDSRKVVFSPRLSSGLGLPVPVHYLFLFCFFKINDFTSHAVHLLEAGAIIKNVSERLRHISVKVTADTFLYIAQKIKEERCPSMSDTLRDKD